MTQYEELLQKYDKLQKELYETMSKLYQTSDGYHYKITSICYGMKRTQEFINAWEAQGFIDESMGGENYIIDKVESDNPEWNTNLD